MKFIRYFNESTSDFYHPIDREEFVKKLGTNAINGLLSGGLPNITDFDYIELSELSEFFQSKFSDMDYSRGSKILTLEPNSPIGHYRSKTKGIPLTKLRDYRNKQLTGAFLRDAFRSWEFEIKKLKLTDDNCFAFSFTEGTIFRSDHSRGDHDTISDLCRSLVIIFKITDEYFLVCDISSEKSDDYRNYAMFQTDNQNPFIDCKYFLCDDIEGLTTFLDDNLSRLREYRYDKVYQLYLKEN